jgi:hypothetical protein
MDHVPLDQSIENACAALTSYRKDFPTLTSLGQEAELEKLQEAFQSIFIDQPAHIEAFIESTERVGSDLYQTVLIDRLPGTEAFRCRVTLTFDDEFKEAMAALPAGSKIILVAKIEDVRPEPDWADLATSEGFPQFHLSGTIVRLEAEQS